MSCRTLLICTALIFSAASFCHGFFLSSNEKKPCFSQTGGGAGSIGGGCPNAPAQPSPMLISDGMYGQGYVPQPSPAAAYNRPPYQLHPQMHSFQMPPSYYPAPNFQNPYQNMKLVPCYCSVPAEEYDDASAPTATVVQTSQKITDNNQ